MCAKKLVIDLDGTLVVDDRNLPYAERRPNEVLAARLREYHAKGYEIIIQSARNMRTYSSNMGKINANTLPIIVTWLIKNNIPYDEIHVGKPWCGFEGFYVDDKSVRPSEFVSLSEQEIETLLEREK